MTYLELLATICLLWYFFIVVVSAIGFLQMYIYALDKLPSCPDDTLEYEIIHRYLCRQRPLVFLSRAFRMSRFCARSRASSLASTNVSLPHFSRHIRKINWPYIFASHLAMIRDIGSFSSCLKTFQHLMPKSWLKMRILIFLGAMARSKISDLIPRSGTWAGATARRRAI